MLHYNPRLKSLARALRTRSTLSEVLLWRQLKGRQRRGIDFHRQKPVGEFIIDFFAAAPMLAVEIDGDTHRFKDKEDLDRQRKLEALGIHFLRFDDWLVKTNIDGVTRTIDAWLEDWEGRWRE
jgi:very-short-patch-repair endonuclease